MIDKNTAQLTLDRPARYQINVPGELETERLGFIQEMTVTVDEDQNRMPVTILTGVFDQSALQGFLRYLYSLGIPLLLVLYLGGDEPEPELKA